MTGKFKDFYKFVKCVNSGICELWEDFNNRPDPNPGDEYMYERTTFPFKIIFDKVEFDSKFENGVAFYYVFHTEDGDEFKIHSINDVYDTDKLTDLRDLYRFWTDCKPVNQ